MKITSVDVYRVLVPAPRPPFIWRRGLLGSPSDGYAAVLSIQTDDGCDGVALTPRRASGAALPDLVDGLSATCCSARTRSSASCSGTRFWELDRVEEMPLYLLGTVDIALWDLAGDGELPTWELFGGFRTEIPAYASTDHLRQRRRVPRNRRPVPGARLPGDQVARLRRCPADAQAVRRPPGARRRRLPLMYDGSAGFDLPDAVYLGMRSPTPATSGTRSQFGSSRSPRTNGWPSGQALRCWSAKHPTALI